MQNLPPENYAGGKSDQTRHDVCVCACVRACACISLFICVCICLYSCVYIAVYASIHSCVRMTLHTLKTPRRAKAGAVGRKEKVSQVQLARPAWHPGD